MAGWGLLQGLGRGISQGAEIMSRGMAEDREAERQRMREASIEKRWKKQEAKEDARYADAQKRQSEQMQYQQERDKVGDARHAEQMGMAKQELNIRISERRKAEIEGNIQAVQREWDKASDSIERRYERLIDQARKEDAETPLVADKDGKKPESALDKAYRARDQALEELSERMGGKLMPIIKSYGSELKGTAYGSLYDDLLAEKSASKDRAGQQFLKDAGVTDAAGDFAASATKTGGGRGDLVSGITGGGATSNPEQQKQLLQPGFSSGMESAEFMSQGEVDLSDATPLEVAKSKIGQAAQVLGNAATPATSITGGLLQIANKNFIQPAWDYANTRPSQRNESQADKDKRLGLMQYAQQMKQR